MRIILYVFLIVAAGPVRAFDRPWGIPVFGFEVSRSEPAQILFNPVKLDLLLWKSNRVVHLSGCGQDVREDSASPAKCPRIKSVSWNNFKNLLRSAALESRNTSLVNFFMGPELIHELQKHYADERYFEAIRSKLLPDIRQKIEETSSKLASARYGKYQFELISLFLEASRTSTVSGINKQTLFKVCEQILKFRELE